MYCLDANVWIYYFDDGLDEHAAVREPVSGSPSPTRFRR